MPQHLQLKAFGEMIYEAFGYVAYHVGSSLMNKRDWRDVDVRVLIPEAEYVTFGLGHPDHPHSNPRWVSLCMAFTALGKQMTGLPIDFQIQCQERANKEFSPSEGHPRSALLCSFRFNDEYVKKYHEEKATTPAQ